MWRTVQHHKGGTVCHVEFDVNYIDDLRNRSHTHAERLLILRERSNDSGSSVMSTRLARCDSNNLGRPRLGVGASGAETAFAAGAAFELFARFNADRRQAAVAAHAACRRG